MFFILIFLALLSGVAAFVALWPYGVVFRIVSAPIIASLMTFIGAFLIRPSAFQTSILSKNRRSGAESTAEVKLNENLSAD
jgi:hypothetical protein